MFGWNKNPNEKRVFVNKETGEPVQKPVVGPDGHVVGMAGSPMEEHKMHTEAEQEFKEAA